MAVSLGITFGSSNGAGDGNDSRAASWREGMFSNWTVVLGDRRLRLHKYNLARASSFLEAAMSDAYERSETDLTNILPKPCWQFFDSVLDVIYSEGPEEPDARGPRGDGVLTAANVVHLLVTADVLSMRRLFERAVQFLEREMASCCLYVWRACLEFENPLNSSLEKVSAAAREGVVRAFEKLLVLEEDALLALPYDVMLGLLQDNRLAVRGEVRLAYFVLTYGRTHGLVDVRVHQPGAVEETLCGGAVVAAQTLEEDSVYRNEPSQVRWRRLCAALRWTEIEEFHLRMPDWLRITGVEQDELSGPLTPAKLHKNWEAFPVEFATVGALHNRALRGPKVSHKHAAAQVGPYGLVLRPREMVRPPRAPPLLSHQVQKFFYFAGAETPGFERGQEIYSQAVCSGLLHFQIKLFPLGERDFDLGDNTWAVSAFVEVVPQASWPDPWEFRDVRFSIQIVPWSGNPELVFKQSDTFSFNSTGSNHNRGWKKVLTSGKVRNRLREMLNPEGYLVVQAEVAPSSAMQGPWVKDPGSQSS